MPTFSAVSLPQIAIEQVLTTTTGPLHSRRICTISSIFKLFVLVTVLHGCTCNILVVNKLNRKAFTVEPDRILSGIQLSLEKVQLHHFELTEKCHLPEVSQLKGFSIYSTNDFENKDTVLVIGQSDKEECVISHIIAQAKKVGYIGIIFCADTMTNFRDVEAPSDDFYASVILSCERHRMPTSNASRYKISIHPDPTPRQKLEFIIDTIDTFLHYSEEAAAIVVKVMYFVVKAIVFLLILSPLYILIAAMIFINSRGCESSQNAYEPKSKPKPTSQHPTDLRMVSFRRILGVGLNASREQIKKAFKNKALTLARDKNLNLNEREIKEKENEYAKCIEAKNALLENVSQKR
ncbi:hypothetical protein Bhyg_12551 [Pseudolycoriella hygida]|uniref:Uncharacterized protein n=1 Tax=Pseudolycoriella hygida TaxID=35572 RepID=A0A9Q0MZ16_9DIPT|nr:hypothetical protein Bhyg_12551 [Pseudolycoriella hygida]